jgi:hypothetical protein
MVAYTAFNSIPEMGVMVEDCRPTPSIVICSCGFSVVTVIPENRMHRVIVPINSLVTFIFHPLVLKKHPA